MNARDIYSGLLEEDLSYQSFKKDYDRNVKNARRNQRRQKQAQRDRYYDGL